MPPELSPFLEYGAVGILAGVLFYLGRLFYPQYQQLTQAVAALATTLPALTAAVEGQGQELKASLGEIRRELAVVTDRLPRAVAPPAGEPVPPVRVSDRDRLLEELLALRRAKLDRAAAEAAAGGD
jgi:hypothetical protein